MSNQQEIEQAGVEVMTRAQAMFSQVQMDHDTIEDALMDLCVKLAKLERADAVRMERELKGTP